MRTHALGVLLAAWSFYSIAVTARGETLFETATGARIGQTGGSGNLIDDDYLLAVNFRVFNTVTTGSIGAHLLDLSPGTSIFGAIVALTDANDVPDSSDLSTPDVRGVTLIDSGSPSRDSAGDLQVVLTPGWYALVFGTGRFGATGAAEAIHQNEVAGEPYIYAIRGNPIVEIIQQSPGARLFVRTTPAFVSGDVNGDGLVNSADVLAFSAALLGLPIDPTDVERADINADGAADGLDIPGFISAFLN